MCGRFAQDATLSALMNRFQFVLDEAFDFSAQYNIDPGDFRGSARREPDAAYVVAEMEGARTLAPMKWCYAASWAKEPFSARSTFNARAEGLTQSKLWKPAFEKRRCIVPMTGFFEFPGAIGHKTPHYIFLKDEALFGVAGLWSHWQGGSPERSLHTFTVITCEANEFVRPLHPKGRMPVILHQADESAWLDPANTDFDALLNLLKSYPADAMTAYPVADFVKNPTASGKDCVKEVPLPPTNLELF